MTAYNAQDLIEEIDITIEECEIRLQRMQQEMEELNKQYTDQVQEIRRLMRISSELNNKQAEVLDLRSYASAISGNINY